MNALPGAIPAGPRYAAPAVAEPVAYAESRPEPVAPPPVAPAPAPYVAPAPVAVAMNAAPPLPEPPVAEPPPPAPLPPLPVARPIYTAPARSMVQVAELPDESLPVPEPRQQPEARAWMRAAPRAERSRAAPPATRYASLGSSSIPLPPALPPHMPFQMAAESQRPMPGGHGFHLIAPAMAEPIGSRHGSPAASGDWAIQVGAFASSGLAASAAAAARGEARGDLAHARGSVSEVRQGRATLYRARLQGLSRDGAAQACERLSRQRTNCMVVSPDAQS
jgi:hypothetical protein